MVLLVSYLHYLNAQVSQIVHGAIAVMSTTNRLLNVNVGVVGHVDSGKTSLCRQLSTTLSTASLDRPPQSQQRGITLDLGFSAFTAAPSPQLSDKYDLIQYTLVDCPGHASLIRTVIGGASIMDIMLIIIDGTKGIQTQTAECIVLAEILTERIVVVVNKADRITDASKLKVEKNMAATFRQTKFQSAPIVFVCAASDEAALINVQPVIDALTASITAEPIRYYERPFYLAVDHCFSIKGQGTILTGTVLAGSVNVNDTVELPALRLSRKVKSMQMFHKSVDSARAGDRVGMCVTQLDSNLVERGIVCAPQSVQTYSAVIARVSKIRYYKLSVMNRDKYHISIGHATAMATVQFFTDTTHKPADIINTNNTTMSSAPIDSFSFEKEYLHVNELPVASSTSYVPCASSPYYVLLELEKPIQCAPTAVIVGSRLDADITFKSCRLAFQALFLVGQVVTDTTSLSSVSSFASRIRTFKIKERTGVVDRITDERSFIGRDMFHKGTDLTPFIGLRLTLANGLAGRIEGGFGQSGKYRVTLDGAAVAAQSSSQAFPTTVIKGMKMTCRYKKFLHDNSNTTKIKLRQDGL